MMSRLLLSAWLLGLLVIASTSCTNSPYAHELSQADSLSKELDVVKQASAKIDSSGITACNDTITKHITYLQRNFTDTLNRESAIIISDYARLRKSIKQLKDKHRELMYELKNTNEQLTSLSKDIRNEKIQKEDLERFNKKFPDAGADATRMLFQQYIDAETQVVQKMHLDTEMLIKGYSKVQEKFNDWKPAVETIVSETKEKNS